MIIAFVVKSKKSKIWQKSKIRHLKNSTLFYEENDALS